MRKTKIADGGRKDKGTGKAKNIVGAKPKVYGNSNYQPSASYYSKVRYDYLSDADRAEREKSVLNDMGPFAPLAIPAIGIIRGTTAIGDLIGGRKYTMTRNNDPRRVTKRGR